MKIGFDNEKYLKMQSEHIRASTSSTTSCIWNSAESCSTISTHPAFFRALHLTQNYAC